MSALSEQPGGSHYKTKAIQPVQYIHANGLGFCEGNVVKYVTRHREKGGAEDLLKAIHYCQLLLEMEYAHRPSDRTGGAEMKISRIDIIGQNGELAHEL